MCWQQVTMAAECLGAEFILKITGFKGSVKTRESHPLPAVWSVNHASAETPFGSEAVRTRR